MTERRTIGRRWVVISGQTHSTSEARQVAWLPATKLSATSLKRAVRVTRRSQRQRPIGVRSHDAARLCDSS